jgi:hypothetical protein
MVEISDLAEEDEIAFDPLINEYFGALADEDVEQSAESLPINTDAALVLFEHRWAIGLQQALNTAGGFLLDSAYINPRTQSEVISKLINWRWKMLRRRPARRRVARRAVGRKAVRRRRGRRLLGAAAVGGAGYYAGKKISEGRQQEDMQDQQIADLQDQAAVQQQATYAPPPPAAPPQAAPAPQEDTISQLERLGDLKDQGVLTEEEFQAQKAKILGT